MLYRNCFIPSLQAQAVPNNFIQLYAEMSTVLSWNVQRIHNEKGAIKNVNIIGECRPKYSETEFLIAISRPAGDNCQSKTLVVAISDPRSLIVKSVF